MLIGCVRASVRSVTSRFLKEGVLHSCQGLTKLNLSRTNVGDKGEDEVMTEWMLVLKVGVLGNEGRGVGEDVGDKGEDEVMTERMLMSKVGVLRNKGKGVDEDGKNEQW